ncbi:MAG: hypothetical protein CVV18_00405 [Gammaproteobacteria bacterium HGW-Gammaproteobacteria-8]|nr:MAG: hypothetical protein CVV18_00405 [Gammaproteobacteria bacterium HGW-Gammaproteobacteria-8]
MPVLIKRGHRGQHVVRIQTHLNLEARFGYSAFGQLAEDGIFGPKTAQRVAEWQQMKGLVADGIVGPNTWNAMFHAPIPANAAGGSTGASAPVPPPAPPPPPQRGILYVHSHDVPGKGQNASIHRAEDCHHIIVPPNQAADAPRLMASVIDSNNLTLSDMVLNTHGGGAGRISIGGAMIDLQRQPRFFKSVKGRFESGAIVRIIACAFATASVPLNDREAWLVTPDELAYGDGIKALQVVAGYLGVQVNAGFGMQFGDMSGYTGVWVSCQPNGNYRYHWLGRRLSISEFLGMIDEMIMAGPFQFVAQLQKLKRWLVG